jgi:hypothetical protein
MARHFAAWQSWRAALRLGNHGALRCGWAIMARHFAAWQSWRAALRLGYRGALRCGLTIGPSNISR